MVYKGKYSLKVLIEFEESLKSMTCPKHKEYLKRMVEMKNNLSKKELNLIIKDDVLCCKAAEKEIKETAWKIFAQN